jgi:hypothetical protein
MEQVHLQIHTRVRNYYEMDESDDGGDEYRCQGLKNLISGRDDSLFEFPCRSLLKVRFYAIMARGTSVFLISDLSARGDRF